jgi:hypothetical protein
VSWRLIVFNFDGHPPPVKLEPGFRPRSMGPAEWVRDSISSLLTGVEWSDAARGTFDEGAYAMWFRLANPEGSVDRVDVEVMGGGDPLPVLALLCQVNGWFAYDVAERVFLDPDAPKAAGWEAQKQALKA